VLPEAVQFVETHREPLSRVPVAWIDSEAASTTTDLDPYLPMLRAVAKMYHRYCDPDPRADSFVAVIESMDADSWHRLLDNIPVDIASRDPSSFPQWAGVDAAAVADAAGITAG